MNARNLVVAFVIGLIVGVVGATYLPEAARPYLPESIAGKLPVVKAAVLAKQRMGTTLLLTMNTPQGAMLATVTKNADAVDLLVGGDDTIELSLRNYSPFIDNPRILRVIKGPQAALPEPDEATAGAPGKDAKEGKLRGKAKSSDLKNTGK